MVKNLEKKILWLIVIFFISPYGFGFTFIPGLQSLDLPKIIPLLFFIIVTIKFDFKKVDKSILILLALITLHFFSIFYSSNIQVSIVDFTSNLILFYPGFFIPFILIRSKESLKKLMIFINGVVIFYIIISITEFIFQVNIYDFVRNSYTEDSRFNNLLGTIRLGLKASMGPFASTLPFAYTFITLFFLKDLYTPPKINKKYLRFLFTLLAIIGLFFTLSRAAIIILLILISIKYLYNSAFKTKILFFFSTFILILILLDNIKDTVFENYIKNYIVNIFDTTINEDSVDSRLGNNTIDLSFALESPILGHGAGTLYYNKVGGRQLNSSDSSYLLTILSDRGFVSLFLLLVLIFISYNRYLSLRKINSEEFNYKSLFFSFLAIFLCINSSQRLEVLFLFFFILGLINSIYLLNKKTI